VITAVIPVYDQPDCFDRCISSLEPSVRAGRAGAVVINNGSREKKTRDLLRSCSRWARVIEMGENTGFVRATNAGLRTIGSGHALWLNSDCILPSNWIDRTESFIAAHPEAGAFGPRSNNGSWAGGGAFNQVVEYGGTDSQADINAFSASMPDDPSRFAVVDDRGIWGFCMVVPERARRIVGLIDERFIMGGCDDFDYCARVIEAGMRVMVADTFFAWHYGSKTIASVPGFHEKSRGNYRVYESNRRRARSAGGPRSRGRQLPPSKGHGRVKNLLDYEKPVKIRQKLR